MSDLGACRQSPLRPKPPVDARTKMSMAELYADLGGVNEIAEALGVKLYRVKRWIERRESSTCPAPVRTISGMHIYSIAQWQAWFAVWRVTRGSETWRRKPKKVQLFAGVDDPS